jgi:acetoin utilization protein AcuC
MNHVILIYSEDFKKMDFGPNHPMQGDRYEKAWEEFKKINILNKVDIKKPKIISEEIIKLFHTPTYIKKVQEVSRTGHGYYGEEVPQIKGIYDIILLSVSASITGADSIIDNNPCNVAVNICGGWHHAFENEGRGFCVFNDIAISANYLLKKKGINKIMILDYDAHHGDGTQRAFYNNSQVYTISIHQNPMTLFPFQTGYEEEIGEDRGKGFNKNFPLSSYCNDSEFIHVFNQIPELIKDFAPEVLIIQMGVDGSKENLISSLQLTEKSYDYASKTIAQLQKEITFKILALGGGGFVHPALGKNWGIQIKNFI